MTELLGRDYLERTIATSDVSTPWAFAREALR